MRDENAVESLWEGSTATLPEKRRCYSRRGPQIGSCRSQEGPTKNNMWGFGAVVGLVDGIYNVVDYEPDRLPTDMVLYELTVFNSQCMNSM